MYKYSFLLIAISCLLLNACAVSPPKLPQVQPSAKEKPINSAAWDKRIKSTD